MATRKAMRAAASETSKAAQEHLRSGRENFKGDAHMIKVYRTDAADLREIAGLLREGKRAAAYDKASGLDTLVRELIPEAAWTVMFCETEGACPTCGRIA